RVIKTFLRVAALSASESAVRLPSRAKLLRTATRALFRAAAAEPAEVFGSPLAPLADMASSLPMAAWENFSMAVAGQGDASRSIPQRTHLPDPSSPWEATAMPMAVMAPSL